MTIIERNILIHARVGPVFEYAADWRHWSDWFEGVSDFRPISHVEQGNGARYRYKARMMGLPATVETEIHEYVENSGWTGVATRGLPHKTRWAFEASGEDTVFTYSLEYELPIPLVGRMIDALVMKRQWRRIIDRSLENLKVRCETQAGHDAVSRNQGSA